MRLCGTFWPVGRASAEISCSGLLTRFEWQITAGIEPDIDTLKLMELELILHHGSGAGGRAGSGVAATEIVAKTQRQIAAQKITWERWDLNLLVAGGMSIGRDEFFR